MSAAAQLAPVLVERRFRDADGTAEPAHRGLTLSLSLDGRWASARLYDDEPGVAHVTLEPPRGWRGWVLRLRGELRWAGIRRAIGAGAAWQAVPWDDPLLCRLLAALSMRDGLRRIHFLADGARELSSARPVGREPEGI